MYLRAITPRLAGFLLLAIGLMPASPSGADAPTSGLATPSSAATGALCRGVSAGAVSRAVGYQLHPPKATVTATTFDQTLHIHESSTDCIYQAVSPALVSAHEVTLDYERLSKSPPRAVVVADIKASLASGARRLPGAAISYSVVTRSGITSIFATISEDRPNAKFTYEFDFGWRGTKVAGALIFQKLPFGTIAALEKLALANWDV
jgi:hypothetical protein